MDRLLVLMTAFSLGLIVVILVSVRREHIRVESSVSWLVAAVVLLFITSSHQVLSWISKTIGVGDGVSALLIVWGVVFISVLYRLSIRLSQLKDSNIALTQQLAILEFRLESLKETRATTEGRGQEV
jgi:hypothetical protein